MRRSGRPQAPDDPDDAAAAEALAVRILRGAAQSGDALQRRLERRGFSAAAAATAVSRCTALGYVDDQALARSLVDRHVRARHGRFRIVADLRSKGIDDEAIESATETLEEGEQDAAVLAAQQLRRRAGGEGALDDRSRQRIGAALQRRGFSGSVIVRALRALD